MSVILKVYRGASWTRPDACQRGASAGLRAPARSGSFPGGILLALLISAALLAAATAAVSAVFRAA
ncbi:MAG TPA: hypothetical protein VK586_26530 [Streptosporangiaceae bacterium]|nr:hypothetical protein [Streptosporangiaceae bacterium]